jgi:hypothetical protein
MIEELMRLHASCSDSNGSDINCSDSNGSSLPCHNSRLIAPKVADSQQPSAAVTMASHPAQKHSTAPPRSAAEPRQRSNRRSPPRSELEGIGVHPGQVADAQGDRVVVTMNGKFLPYRKW